MGWVMPEDMPENQGGQSIMYAPWPKPFDEDFRGMYGLDDCYLEFADTKYALVSEGRKSPARRKHSLEQEGKVYFQTGRACLAA